ncbi:MULTISPECIES: BamA/TamA family outer membrane protein [Myxococcaceae]|uniref:Omp85 family outer membrane protein n=1 Tax=Myxococcaceae TaxID=31 RepID=UPI001E489AC3|nr:MULTISPECIES: BamA/TamA family outer membrane protein [Myxococcaceae]
MTYSLVLLAALATTASSRDGHAPAAPREAPEAPVRVARAEPTAVQPPALAQGALASTLGVTPAPAPGAALEAATVGAQAALLPVRPVPSGAPPVAPEGAHRSEGVRQHGVDMLALPIVSFSSDQGMGYGVVGGAYVYGEGYAPYRHALGLQMFVTQRGSQSHFIRYDGPRLLGPLRVEARVEFRRETLSPYFGGGNESAPQFSGDMTDQRFNYARLSPGAWVRLRGKPLGEQSPLQAYVGYNWHTTQVRVYEGSVLSETQPPGSNGGCSAQLLSGLLWDTRDNEVDPTRGGVEELSVRVSAMPTGSSFDYAGVTLGERRYARISSRVLFAQRLSLDVLFGEVPFFEWAQTGGITSSEGVGGMTSVRGIERNRFAGYIKAFSNSELRVHATEFHLLGEANRLGVVGFLDLGRVWHPGAQDGKWYAWHPGVGGGLRLARRAAVVRMDYALSTETGRQGLYFSVGQMF